MSDADRQLAAKDQELSALKSAAGDKDHLATQLAALQGQLSSKDQELTALKDRARRDIEAAKRDALAEIYEQTAALSTAVASKILKRELNASDQKRLVDESIGELQAGRR